MQSCNLCVCKDCSKQYNCPYYNFEDRRYHCNIENVENKNTKVGRDSCPGFSREVK